MLFCKKYRRMKAKFFDSLHLTGHGPYSFSGYLLAEIPLRLCQKFNFETFNFEIVFAGFQNGNVYQLQA